MPSNACFAVTYATEFCTAVYVCTEPVTTKAPPPARSIAGTAARTVRKQPWTCTRSVSSHCSRLVDTTSPYRWIPAVAHQQMDWHRSAPLPVAPHRSPPPLTPHRTHKRQTDARAVVSRQLSLRRALHPDQGSPPTHRVHPTTAPSPRRSPSRRPLRVPPCRQIESSWHFFSGCVSSRSVRIFKRFHLFVTRLPSRTVNSWILSSSREQRHALSICKCGVLKRSVSIRPAISGQPQYALPCPSSARFHVDKTTFALSSARKPATRAPQMA